jgi:hypothetical protein
MHRAPLILLLAASFAATSPAQNASAVRHAARPKARLPVPPAQADVVAPPTERERAVQILNRFTFGARPGDVDRVLAIGIDKWLEQQLRPEAIKDAVLEKRLADFPTLNMTSEQALAAFQAARAGDRAGNAASRHAEPLTALVMGSPEFQMR